jgi:hypothetical protein
VRFERCACGRWKCTDRQTDRWVEWCWRGSPGPKHHWPNREPWFTKRRRILIYHLTTPLWWRLETRCMGWYDCIRRDFEPEEWTDYPWHVRFMFRLQPLRGGEAMTDTQSQSDVA